MYNLSQETPKGESETTVSAIDWNSSKYMIMLYRIASNSHYSINSHGSCWSVSTTKNCKHEGEKVYFLTFFSDFVNSSFMKESSLLATESKSCGNIMFIQRADGGKIWKWERNCSSVLISVPVNIHWEFISSVM